MDNFDIENFDLDAITDADLVIDELDSYVPTGNGNGENWAMENWNPNVRNEELPFDGIDDYVSSKTENKEEIATERFAANIKIYADNVMKSACVDDIRNVGELCKLATKHNNWDEFIDSIVGYESDALLCKIKRSLARYCIWRLFGEDTWNAYNIEEDIVKANWNGPKRIIVECAINDLYYNIQRELKKANANKALHKFKDDARKIIDGASLFKDVLLFMLDKKDDYDVLCGLCELYDYKEYFEIITEYMNNIANAEYEFIF